MCHYTILLGLFVHWAESSVALGKKENQTKVETKNSGPLSDLSISSLVDIQKQNPETSKPNQIDDIMPEGAQSSRDNSSPVILGLGTSD